IMTNPQRPRKPCQVITRPSLLTHHPEASPPRACPFSSWARSSIANATEGEERGYECPAPDLDRGGRAERPARLPDGPRVGRLPARHGGGRRSGPRRPEESAGRPGTARAPGSPAPPDGGHPTAALIAPASA